MWKAINDDHEASLELYGRSKQTMFALIHFNLRTGNEIHLYSKLKQITLSPPPPLDTTKQSFKIPSMSYILMFYKDSQNANVTTNATGLGKAKTMTESSKSFFRPLPYLEAFLTKARMLFLWQ
ncbi:CLUMA_CG016838, isoform A [Clunio marinus]|uniref:CLUMA_CG016838, isoform A n=1 Tax=Clunio marinus TaxID=568069 RepID=A0A1J1IYD2_9DIPT|nr:CLUMA_CG016838, isoform A [Clunio marinus]